MDDGQGFREGVEHVSGLSVRGERGGHGGPDRKGVRDGAVGRRSDLQLVRWSSGIVVPVGDIVICPPPLLPIRRTSRDRVGSVSTIPAAAVFT